MYADINGRTSGYLTDDKGVRQDENWSPLLLYICLNDIESYPISEGYDGVTINISDEIIAVLLKLLSYFIQLILYQSVIMLMNSKT